MKSRTGLSGAPRGLIPGFCSVTTHAPYSAGIPPIPALDGEEGRARGWTAGERLALRQREAVPILDRIESYLDDLSQRVLPKSALGRAVTDARNQSAALRRYTSDGLLTIDNNISGRTLRLQATGRKN